MWNLNAIDGVTLYFNQNRASLFNFTRVTQNGLSGRFNCHERAAAAAATWTASKFSFAISCACYRTRRWNLRDNCSSGGLLLCSDAFLLPVGRTRTEKRFSDLCEIFCLKGRELYTVREFPATLLSFFFRAKTGKNFEATCRKVFRKQQYSKHFLGYEISTLTTKFQILPARITQDTFWRIKTSTRSTRCNKNKLDQNS